MGKGVVLPEFKDLVVTRQVDLLHDRMAIVLYEPAIARPNPVRFIDLGKAIVSKPVALSGRRFYRGIFYADDVMFEAFADGSASQAALYFDDQNTPDRPLAVVFKGVVARPNAGPVRLSWPGGWFVL